MKQHLLLLVATVVATAALIGCAGKTDDHVIGTQDTRILGDWQPVEIHFGGQTQACPGSIIAGDPGNEDEVKCTADLTHFSLEGRISSGSVSHDYFFSTSGLLTVYTSPTANIEVTFENSDTRMKYSFTQRGRDVEVIFDRPVTP
jgi:hypothetical protein